jgi:hypothetical protein
MAEQEKPTIIPAMSKDIVPDGSEKDDMPDLLDRLRGEARAVAAAPVLLAIIILVAIGAIWGTVFFSYRQIIANKDAYIASLSRRVADYREKLGGANPEEAKQQLDALRTEVATLRLRLQPRHLTTDQRQQIIDRSLLPAGGQPRPLTVIHQRDCTDCAPFAAELAEALQAAGGWIVSTESIANSNQRPRAALAIRVPDALRPPPEAKTLQQSLLFAGLPFAMMSGGTGSNIALLVLERIPE